MGSTSAILKQDNQKFDQEINNRKLSGSRSGRMKFSRSAPLAVAIIILISILGSAASTYILFIPKSITTLPASTITETTQDIVTAVVPTTLTQIQVQTVVQTSSIYLSPEEVESLNSTSGLQLELATNVSVIYTHPQFPNESSGILVLISLFNTLATSNNLSAAEEWALPDLSPGLCSNYNQPFGIDVMKGYYTSSNITSSTPLPLFAPSFCPVYFPPAFFVFDPKSNYVNTVSSPKTSILLVTNYSSTFTRTSTTQYTNPLGDAEREIPLSGYCCTEVPNAEGTGFTYRSIPFTEGTYTIAGGDEWGDLLLMHFTVMP